MGCGDRVNVFVRLAGDRMKRNLILQAGMLGVLLLGSVVYGGAYDRLDNDKLGRTLRKMQMNTLLEALAEQTGDFTLRIEALMSQANAAGKTDEAERDKLLDEAGNLVLKQAGKYAEEIKKYNKGDDKYEDTTIIYYKTFLQYFNITVAQRGGLCFNRIEYLIGSEEDRKKVLELTNQAEKILSKELRRLQNVIKRSRSSAILMSYLVPELEKIQMGYRFQEAQILFYNAMVQPATAPEMLLDDETGRYKPKLDEQGKPIMGPNPKIAGSLRKAITDIKPFAESSEYGVQPQGKLLLGRCYTEIGEYDKASETLKWLTTEKVPQTYLVQGLFAIFKNQVSRAGHTIVAGKDIEAGKGQFEQGKKDIENYLDVFAKMQAPLTVDFRRLAMEYYLYEKWGEALGKAGAKPQAVKCNEEIQKLFMGFLDKHKNPAVQAQVAEIFSGRLSMDGGNTAGMSPVILLILATTKIDEAQKLQGDVLLNELSDELRRKVTTTRAMAIEMLDGICKNDSAAAKAAKPQALWKLGVLYVNQLDNFKAMKAFRELARDYKDNENALPAAMNAVNIGAQLIQMREESGEVVPWETREQYIESLQQLLTNWPDDKRGVEYHFDLAWQCGKMVGLNPDQAESKWYPQAIKNYEKVPPESPLYDRANFEALELRFLQLISSSEAKKQKQEAGDLNEKLLKFGAMAHRKRIATKDASQKADLGDWGSKSEFYGLRLANEILGQGSDAGKKIESLPDRWAETEILETSRAYAIENRVKMGDVDKAIEQLKAFEKQYGLAKTGKLTDTVVDALRDSIAKLVENGNEDEKLKQYRNDYLRFAKQIYTADGKSTDIDAKWRATVLLGDSLVQSGTKEGATRALKLFQELGSIENQKLAAERKKVDDYINQKLVAVEDTQKNPANIKNIRPVLDEAFRHFGQGDWNINSRYIANRSIENLSKTDPKKDREKYDKLVRQVIINSRRALVSLGDRMKKSAGTVDPIVILGIASSNQLLGNYSEAVKNYRLLVKGGLDLSNPSQRSLYWEAQLGLCQCSFELGRGKREKLRELSFYISQLESSDPELGGNRFRGKIRAIAADSRNEIKK